MKKIKAVSIIGLITFGVISFVSCQQGTQEKAPDLHDTANEQIAHGEYLVRISGCGDCHSSKTFGPQGMTENEEVLLGGYEPGDSLPVPSKKTISQALVFNQQNTEFAGPWGISYAANITSDETGIGNWSFEQFETAMREGKYKGLKNSRGLLPPMPWKNYVKMSDSDMRAIFAYLKSTKPVKNIVPPVSAPAIFQ